MERLLVLLNHQEIELRVLLLVEGMDPRHYDILFLIETNS